MQGLGVVKRANETVGIRNRRQGGRARQVVGEEGGMGKKVVRIERARDYGGGRWAWEGRGQ